MIIAGCPYLFFWYPNDQPEVGAVGLRVRCFRFSWTLQCSSFWDFVCLLVRILIPTPKTAGEAGLPGFGFGVVVAHVRAPFEFGGSQRCHVSCRLPFLTPQPCPLRI